MATTASSTSGSHAAGAPHDAHHDAHHGGHDEHHHHELDFLQKWVFSTDHKVIGCQYAFCGLAFLFLGFLMMLVMRWQLANPGVPVPVVGNFLRGAFGPVVMTDAGALTASGYNVFGAMHGTIMVFFGIVPLAVAGFGNIVVPLQVGAPDMCYPKLNMASFWCFFTSGVMMLASFFVPGSAAKSGWTAYPPLSGIADLPVDSSVWLNGQTVWLLAMVFNITGSLLGSINFISTIIQLRAPGLTWMRLPFSYGRSSLRRSCWCWLSRRWRPQASCS